MLFTNLNNLKYWQGKYHAVAMNKMAEGKAKSSSDGAGVNNGEVVCF